MYAITRSGTGAAAAALDIRDIPTGVLPYAASTAATKSAIAARKAVIERMPTAFDRPTPYTLNSLFVVPSTTKTLSARVAVKNYAAGNAIQQESYLIGEVFGGVRKPKRFELALRFAGILRQDELVVPGNGVQLDQYGNIPASIINAILRQVGAKQRGGATLAPTRARRVNGQTQEYVVGEYGKSKTRGVWLRTGRKMKLIMLFTSKVMNYRKRLQFSDIADAAAREEFPKAFYEAAAGMMSRRG